MVSGARVASLLFQGFAKDSNSARCCCKHLQDMLDFEEGLANAVQIATAASPESPSKPTR